MDPLRPEIGACRPGMGLPKHEHCLSSFNVDSKRLDYLIVQIENVTPDRRGGEILPLSPPGCTTEGDSPVTGLSEPVELFPGSSGDSASSSRTLERSLFFRQNEVFGIGIRNSSVAEGALPEFQTSVLALDGYFSKFIPDAMIRQIADRTNRRLVPTKSSTGEN